MKRDARLSFKNAFGILESNFGKVKAQAIINTVKDIRSRSRRSMKQGNKSRTLKSGRVKQITGAHSKPGEPPFRHSGGLYNSILWDKVLENRTLLKVIVGPTNFAGRPSGEGSVPTILEKGGTVIKRVIEYRRSTPRPRFRNTNKRGDLWSNRPTLRNSTKEERGEGNGRYTYFYTREAWEKASQSPRFLQWARGKETVVEKRIYIAPRPYMEPAVKYETTPERWAARLQRAAARMG